MKNDNEVTSNNGITLVALVISIIVLLILSMVSVNALVGENGLLTQAQEARTLTLLSEIMFDLESNILDIKMENLFNDKTMTNADMLYALNKKELFRVSDKVAGVMGLNGAEMGNKDFNRGLTNLEINYNGDIWMNGYKKGKISLGSNNITTIINPVDGKSKITAIDGTIEKSNVDGEENIYYLHAIDEENFGGWVDQNCQIVSMFPNAKVFIKEPRDIEYIAVCGKNFYNGLHLSDPYYYYSELYQAFKRRDYPEDGLISAIIKNDDKFTIEVNDIHYKYSFFTRGGFLMYMDDDVYIKIEGYIKNNIRVYISPDSSVLEDIKNTMNDKEAPLYCYSCDSENPNFKSYAQEQMPDLNSMPLYNVATYKSVPYPVFFKKDRKYFNVLDVATIEDCNISDIKEYFENLGYKDIKRLYYRAVAGGKFYEQKPVDEKNVVLDWEEKDKEICRYEDSIKFIDV